MGKNKMGKIKDILIESRDWHQEMMLMYPHGSDLYTRFYLQTWGLNHVIGMITRAEKMKQSLINRIKTREK